MKSIGQEEIQDRMRKKGLFDDTKLFVHYLACDNTSFRNPKVNLERLMQ